MNSKNAQNEKKQNGSSVEKQNTNTSGMTSGSNKNSQNSQNSKNCN